MKNIKSILKNNESQNQEFKTSFDKDTINTIVAFSNTHGGTIFIGVNNNLKIVGVDVNDEVLKDWLNQIKMHTQPQILPEMLVIKYLNKKIVEIKVQEYPIKPVSVKGRYYKRIGASNHQILAEEIAQIYMQSINSSFDSVLLNETIEDLDLSLINEYFNEVKQKGRISISNNNIDNLKKLGFIKDKITFAALLLFGNHNTGIHIGRFKSPSTIIDDIIIKEPLVEAINLAMNFIKKNIRLGFEFTGEIQRKEKWQFPLLVIRELLLNSIIHRDYKIVPIL